MKKLTLFLITILCYTVASAQNIPNPYASIGKPAPKMATLSNGAYDEFFIKDSLVLINGDAISRKTGELVYSKENNFETIAQLEKKRDEKFRFLSLDPMSAKYPSMSPYSGLSNNPIIFVDPDGRDNIIYLVVANGTKSKVSIATANAIATEANKAYEKLGLNTRVQVVTDANFNSRYTDPTDAVAVLGTTKQQQDYIAKQGPSAKLFGETIKNEVKQGYGSGTYPELSQNEVDHRRSGERGGEFILINEQGLSEFAKKAVSSVAESGAFLIIHGANHNSGKNHFENGNAISSGGNKVYSILNNGALVTAEDNGAIVSFPNVDGYKSIIDFTKNRSPKTGQLQNEGYKEAVKKRFGNNKAEDNYKKNKDNCQKECK